MLDGDLAEHEMVGAREGVDHLQRGDVGGFVVAVPQRLAVDGDDLAGRPRVDAGHPCGEATLERSRVERSEKTAERVVRGDAVREVDQTSQPGPLGVSKGLDGVEALCATDRGTEGE